MILWPGAMPVTLTAAGRKTLKKRVRGARTPWRDRLRAQIVLAAARGRPSARIARDLGISEDTARKWRGRFAACGLAGLEDLPRSGRPRQISAADRAAVVALACQLPAATGVLRSRWTGPELAAELAAQGLVSAPVSVTSAADPGGEPGQAVAVPVLDLSPGPGLRAEGDGDPGSVPGVSSGRAARPGRPDPVVRCQAVHSGPRPHPPDPARGTRQARAGGARVRPPRGARAARRAGRAHRRSVRLHPRDHGHRPVHGPRRAGRS